MRNLIEYVLGTDPTTPGNAAAPRVSIDGGKLTITFTRDTAATDITISVLTGDTPNGTWKEIARSSNGEPFVAIAEGAGVTEQGNDTVITVRTSGIDPDHTARFLKLSVSR